MPNIVETSITLFFCPACARLGKGSVQLSDNIDGQKVCLECCWHDSPSKAQQHSYPCKIYKTVEMEIPVLMRMWDMMRPEKAPTLPPGRPFVSWFIGIEHEIKVAPAQKVWIDQALDFLVTKRLLPLAHYKIVPEANDAPTS